MEITESDRQKISPIGNPRLDFWSGSYHVTLTITTNYSIRFSDMLGDDDLSDEEKLYLMTNWLTEAPRKIWIVYNKLDRKH